MRHALNYAHLSCYVCIHIIVVCINSVEMYRLANNDLSDPDASNALGESISEMTSLEILE